MAKVAIGAGHGINTPGKRTPAGEREWSFNNKVVSAAVKYLGDYENATVVRLDDPTGKTDLPLSTRTNKANNANADILVSYHHNAHNGQWGNWGGAETYHYPGSSSGAYLARAVHPKIVAAMGLRDRGVKSANFHMLRESTMPAILIEGGFMDSKTDIGSIRNDSTLESAGKALADALVDYFNLKKKSEGSKSKPSKKGNNDDFVWLGTNDKGKRVESIYRGSEGLNFYDGPRWSNPSGTFGYGMGWKVDNLYRVDDSLMYRVQNSKGNLYWITASPKYVRVTG